jgi:AP-1 complex subunit gamma-1
MDESTDILMMVTTSLLKDLNNTANNQYVTALALTAIAEISTSEICKSVYLEVKKHMKSQSNIVKTKACLAALRIIKQMPESIDDFLETLDNLVYEKAQPVLMATITLMIEICRYDKKYGIKFKKYVSNLVRILKNLLQGSNALDYEVGGVKDPFLQVKILELFGYIGHGNEESTDEMSDILAHIATNTDTTKNPGNSVLSECARTIMRIEASQGLRVLGINILGRFLSSKENNVRYVALNQLKKVVDIDYSAVQRHRTTITECLKDPDIQIKRQALDLIYKITTHSNVKPIVKELTNHLLNAEADFKGDLSNKICQICEKYAPNKKWHIDTVVKVLTLSESHCREEYISQCITVIATTPELHQYSVTKVYFAMKENLNQIGLVQLGIWLVGEFGEMLVNGSAKNPDGNPIVVVDREIIDMMESILRDHNKKGDRSDIIIMWTLTAIAKLSIRIGQQSPIDIANSVQAINEKIKGMLKTFSSHLNIEIQQRACEFMQILEPKWDNERKDIFDPMPFKGDENMLVDAKDRAALDQDEGENQLLIGFDD